MAVTVIDFGRAVLPYGVFRPPGATPRAGVAVGTQVLDLTAHFDDPVFARPSLNAFMARGRAFWSEVRERVEQIVAGSGDRGLHDQRTVEVLLPIEVADFVDFFSGIEHATNAGRILRPNEEPLKPNWRHLPVGYHGRAGTVVASGTTVRRPVGQLRQGEDIVVAPSERLDIEAELGYIVGTGSQHGTPVPTTAFAEHVFGVVPLIDWSARDIQAWEYQPLGPFLAKSFATSIGNWVVPLEALSRHWVQGPEQTPAVQPYLAVAEPRNLAIHLDVSINGHQLSQPFAAGLYWSPAQQLAHMTRNGASLRTGDLYGTGTISSFDPGGQGSLLELSWNGTRPVQLGEDTTRRAFLADGDEVVISAVAGPERLPLGEVRGTITLATALEPSS
ncbi:fumarylacetoacetate hydrolase family protein [Nocardia sp. NPDC052112]|uniref:fumarylacetoacetate hydrolase family protein n=1 Tax=Nocardia sp. NPDC052112 TaxID=3155646 RepID=UPI0034279D13